MQKLEHSFILKSKHCLLLLPSSSPYHKAMLNHKDEDQQRLELASRIKEAIKSMPRGTKTEIADKLGISPTAITGWEKTGRIAKDSIEVVAKVTGYSLSWLITGKGSKYQLTDNMTDNKKIESNAELVGSFDLWDSNTPLKDDEVALPFFREVELAAGGGRHEVIENHGAKLRFAKITLRRQGVMAEHAYCVTVSGNSMEPVLPDGSTVGIDTANTKVKNGDMYAIDHDGNLRVKMLYQMPGGVLRVRSFNSDEWPDEHYSGDDLEKIRILGRVFWSSALW